MQVLLSYIYFFLSYTKEKKEKNVVSDDECPRYRLSVLLSSTSHVQTFHLASSLHVLLFRKGVVYCTILYLVRSLSLSLYVLADDMLSSSYSFLTFLFWGIVPFPLPEYIHYQWSLSPSVVGDSLVLRESSQMHILIQTWLIKRYILLLLSFHPTTNLILDKAIRS